MFKTKILSSFNIKKTWGRGYPLILGNSITVRGRVLIYILVNIHKLCMFNKGKQKKCSSAMFTRPYRIKNDKLLSSV